MKRILTLLVLLIGSEMTYAQQFQKQTEIALPDSIHQAQSSWIDLDNDGLLDLLISAKSASNRGYLYFIKGDTVNAPQLRTEIIPVFDFNLIDVVDYDLDNDMDVIVTGKKNGTDATAVYLNKGVFQFEEHTLNVPAFSIGKFADLNNDAAVEWIISGTNNGTPYTKILKQEQDYSWKVVHDSIKFSLTALEVIDANGDGRFDLFISGRVKSDSLVSGFLINQSAFYFKSKNTIEFHGVSSTADVNGDGFFDVLIAGKDLNAADQTKLYLSGGGGYAVSNYPLVLNDARSFMADLNSDGIIDVNYIGKNSLGDTLNINKYGAQDYDTLNSKQLIDQCFGDVEHDGDLDLIQLVKRNTIKIVMYENKPRQKNSGPGRPAHAVALPVFNRTFLYWDKPMDDHTTTSALTFDVFLNGNSEYQVGTFDLLNEKRLSVSNGNNITENFRLLKNVPNGSLMVSVQAIDNAFHAGSICVGGGGGGSNCATIETNVLSICHQENVVLKVPHDVLWFSFANGFVGSANEFNFERDQTDTVFSYDPNLIASGCAALKAWTIEINDDTIKTELATRFACVGAQMNFDVESGWDNIKWKSKIKGDLGSSLSTYVVTENDTVSVTLRNAEGCTILRKTAIRVSKPVLTVVADQYKIMKGSSVVLGAGGADRYEWTPSTFLSQSNVPNPTATPTTTIQYTVTGYDSINCTSQAVVTVTVEDSGFVPTLFTPNNDGQNDALKIYGLTSANDFVFTIYNREGSLVFKTSDVNEASQRGWDGFTNGAKQPGGVYFWKVKGSMSTGRKVLLNGKESGSIVLIR
jgi:gliding motility-associated-like protein